MKKHFAIEKIYLTAGLAVAVCVCAVMVCACATRKKLAFISKETVAAGLSLPDDAPAAPSVDTAAARQTHEEIEVEDEDGRRMLIMNAVKDENGEMVAHDRIQVAVVTARFRNVAERRGKVELKFDVTVPPLLQDSKWQLRLEPRMRIMEDTVALEKIVITGAGYRKAQLRGYQQYERFLRSIITDSTAFVDIRQLELFLQRNIPQLYSFKSDSTLVSDERFSSIYGVTEREAVQHYTDKLAQRRNDKRIGRRQQMYGRYVKAPIVTEGIRLDTVMTGTEGFVYCYSQIIAARPRLRKVEIDLPGEIYQQDRLLASIPAGEPLTFYISSLSTLVDGTEHYMTKVVERRVEANTACYIDFAQGKAVIDERLGCNAQEMGRIRENLRALLENERFDLDSITISAFASPEGAQAVNRTLALRRASATAEYFDAFTATVRDSLENVAGVRIELGGADVDGLPGIRFTSRSGGENWQGLDALVRTDRTLPEQWKQRYSKLREQVQDDDARERRLAAEPHYRYLREQLYPRLRVVKFDFFLHRKGMVKDTVHTTVLDTVYMAGVQAIRDRDYETAIRLLRPYNDYNTAVAYCSMDYNASAMAILEKLGRDARVCYLLALVYSRYGDRARALECYRCACSLEPSFIHRGNLDPEIAGLLSGVGG